MSTREDGYYFVRFAPCADIWTIGRWQNFEEGRGHWLIGCPDGVYQFVTDEAAKFAEIGSRVEALP